MKDGELIIPKNLEYSFLTFFHVKCTPLHEQHRHRSHNPTPPHHHRHCRRHRRRHHHYFPIAIGQSRF
jgi:hypothetical protein